MSEEKQTFGNVDERYIENLKVILEGARAEYHQQTFTWRNAQISHLKNYLWASVTLLAVEYGFLMDVIMPGKGIPVPWEIHPSSDFYGLAFFAVAFGVGAFVFALDSCRGRSTILPPTGIPWDEMSNLAWEEKNGEKADGTVLVTMISRLERAAREHQRQNGVRGTKLRGISCALLFSIALTALAMVPW